MNLLEPYIHALGQRVGLPLEASPDGSFTTILGGMRLLVRALESGEAILFYMEVGQPSLFGRGEILARLMEGNLYLAGTRGAALSYDTANERVGLNLLLPLRQLENEEFINAVDNFVAAAVDWGRRLAELNNEAAERAESIGDPADSPMDASDHLPVDNGFVMA